MAHEQSPNGLQVAPEEMLNVAHKAAALLVDQSLPKEDAWECKVDVAAIERNRLAHPQPRDRQQPEHGAVGHAPSRPEIRPIGPVSSKDGDDPRPTVACFVIRAGERSSRPLYAPLMARVRPG